MHLNAGITISIIITIINEILFRKIPTYSLKAIIKSSLPLFPLFPILLTVPAMKQSKEHYQSLLNLIFDSQFGKIVFQFYALKNEFVTLVNMDFFMMLKRFIGLVIFSNIFCYRGLILVCY